jgi:hypothetical protein
VEELDPIMDRPMEQLAEQPEEQLEEQPVEQMAEQLVEQEIRRHLDQDHLRSTEDILAAVEDADEFKNISIQSQSKSRNPRDSKDDRVRILILVGY